MDRIEDNYSNKAIGIENMKQILTSVDNKIEGMVGKTVIKEVSNPLTTNSLEVGMLRAIGDFPREIESETIMDLASESGNLKIENGSVKLKGGVTYHIIIDSRITDSTSEGVLMLHDTITEEDIPDGHLALCSNDLNINYSTTSGITIFTPTKDMKIKIACRFLNRGSMKLGWLNLRIHEIRNNPVNQYGGFESEVLFEGEINKLGTYTIDGDIDDYNLLLVTASTSMPSTKVKIAKKTELIEVCDIEIGLENQFNYEKSNLAGNGSLFYTFINNNTLQTTIINPGTYDSVQITKIVGIKGQLPSLLCGGEF